MRDALTREHRAITAVRGPLVFIEGVHAALGDMVTLYVSQTDLRQGQIIEISERAAVIQVFGHTGGVNPHTTVARLWESGIKADLSPLMLGRVYTGAGVPRDGLPPALPEIRADIHGAAINPLRRDVPRDFIETGLSAIDGLNTLVRGQKLPIFSGAGLPANEIAASIIAHAGVRRGGEKFALVFAGMGVTHREAGFFMDAFDATGALERSVVYLNTAEDPVIERLLSPRYALSAAEYLAFELGYQTLVVLTDMTHYCNALREVSSSREEIPGRRGYPGYLYTDLASLYERAGRIIGREGSVTLLPIVTMPDDDITHPIPDLTGYITEGQIVLGRDLGRKGIFPPISALPSLSRLMDNGIGAGSTREDHRQLADQLYMAYARGDEQRRVAAIVGEEGISPVDRQYVAFAGEFERRFLHQGGQSRSIAQTLDMGWELLTLLPENELVRVTRELIARYLPKKEEGHGSSENQPA